MSEVDQTPDRRKDHENRDLFNRAVAEAASIATQNVAQIHRRRLVTQAFVAAVIVSVLIMLPVALLLYRSELSAARGNARYNCHLLHRLTTPLADFVANDASLRQQQEKLSKDQAVISGYTRLFGKSELAKLYSESFALDQHATDYWTTNVVPRLNAIAAVNCSSRIK